MSHTAAPQGGMFASQSGLPTFGNFGNALLERGNPGLRKSTPDSEALASSDEEVEHSRARSGARGKPLQNRRSSLLADQPHEAPRRSSFASNAYGPAIGHPSQPNTPGTHNDTWSSISPSIGAWNSGSGFPFGANIWGSNPREPPARLQEVRQDPIEARTPTSQSTAVVQRSLSFSVGQTDHDNGLAMSDHAARPGLGPLRRPSRPGTLGHEYSGGLFSVNENEDVGETYHSAHGAPGNRSQSRALSNAGANATASAFKMSRPRYSTQESAELAVDDLEESAQLRYPVRNQPSRRLSDFQATATAPARQPHAPPFSSATFGAARIAPHWSSNLDFGQLDTIPQSRRHSFADVPTRRGSLGSNEDEVLSASYETGSHTLSQGHEQSYFQANVEARHNTEQEVCQQLQQEHHQAVFGGTNAYGYGNMTGLGTYHGPNPAPLFVVNFKCCRSDIFYVQEGTGLSLKDGDLVIVEADRGTDLGCVQHSHITWEAARKYKAKYAEQHFGWLMMFSQQTRSSAPNLFNPNAVGTGRDGQPANARDADVKPKMIKRLAHTHEVQELQIKEGNEAKAKRICQQKVAEHGLNMEILDAEFQMDGKKLTFYFFSNEYINFNALVTDLFKMYKTRIWMSAINPASFQSPVSSLGLTPIYSGNAPVASNPQSAVNLYDEARSPISYLSPDQMSGQRMMPPLYYGGYGQQASPIYDHNQYAPAMQQPGTQYSYGHTQGYPVQGMRNANAMMHRPDAGGRNAPQLSPSAATLAHQFGSMSLAR